ncbi:hypothetical protein BABINDRAFT_126137 [Babjeviella inositovora NRRL Y-12698]|uniref:Zn(2)-C6 fungal-type domain-containing protein n=1 Tax=Babjeviella inositovora NRRL Y-12698 TaxID=984486 RepID=A0A1E3QT63_9ASCO|nr:uncharacterized protein BABINDRAFT_126137 [Babjeviella inositovora NRRL Y-12698]ODQ80694.1 hypothetical protein BABINDRAFT_126137 [Babjeviella inositovora NRRL Y-12698]
MNLSDTNLTKRSPSEDSPEEDSSKKRNRSTVSCLACRRRKIKCDREKPCASCKRRNIPAGLCTYDESLWVSVLNKEQRQNEELETLKSQVDECLDALAQERTRAAQEVRALNQKIEGLTRASQELHAFVSSQPPRLLPDGRLLLDSGLLTTPGYSTATPSFPGATPYMSNPLASTPSSSCGNAHDTEDVGDVRGGPHLPERNPLVAYDKVVNLNKYTFTHTKVNRVIFFGPTSWRVNLHCDSSLHPVLAPFYYLVKMDRQKWKQQKVAQGAIVPDYNLAWKSSTVRDMTDFLEQILPRYEFLQERLEVFFDSVQYLYPYISKEETFRNFRTFIQPVGITGSAGTSSNASSCGSPNRAAGDTSTNAGDIRVKIHVTKKYLDFAHIALLLAIVATGCLFNKNRTFAHTDAAFTDPRHYVSLVLRSLGAARAVEKSSFQALQALLLLRSFKQHDPDDGDGGDGSNGSLLFKMAMSMALTLGLHRSPETIVLANADYPVELHKRLWKHLLYLDATQSCDLGIPLSLDVSYYTERDDGKSTFKGSSAKLDRTVVRPYDLFYRVTPLIADSVLFYTTLTRQVRVLQIEEKIRGMEQFMREEKLLGSKPCGADELTRAVWIMVKYQVLDLILASYYLIYLESDSTLTDNFLKYLLISHRFSENIMEMLEDKESNYITERVIFPSMKRCIIRSLITSCSILFNKQYFGNKGNEKSLREFTVTDLENLRYPCYAEVAANPELSRSLLKFNKQAIIEFGYNFASSKKSNLSNFYGFFICQRFCLLVIKYIKDKQLAIANEQRASFHMLDPSPPAPSDELDNPFDMALPFSISDETINGLMLFSPEDFARQTPGPH